jgi:hypothetical protein
MNKDLLWCIIIEECFRLHFLFPLLLECAKFEYLSSESMTEFVTIIDSVIEVLTPRVLTVIGQRFFFSGLTNIAGRSICAIALSVW